MLLIAAGVLGVALCAALLPDLRRRAGRRRAGRRRTSPKRVRRPSVIPLVAFALLAGLVLHQFSGLGGAGVYGIVMFALLGVKLTLSSVHRAAPTPTTVDTSSWRVAVVVPFYNEDPGLLRDGLRSLLVQTRMPDEVWLIDDGSDDRTTRGALTRLRAELEAAIPTVEFIRFPVNRGKREALAHAFRASAADVFVTLDSDTVLDRQAVAEILKPLAEVDVVAATGLVGASNRRRNLLTRLIDLRYANAFLYERAAYSALGAVLCCCGSLSAYRADVVRAELSDFVNQRFLGAKAVYGDDRRLTNYALLRGRVVLQETARAWTAVPERLGHFLRQQARWNKSFFRESVWVIQNLPLRSAPFALTALELSTWLVFTGMLFTAVVLHPLRTGQALAVTYLAYAMLMAYARSLRYFEAPTSGDTRRFRLLTFLLAPVYGFLHLAILMPLRLYSLFTLRRAGWGTRARVEVRLAPGRAAWGIPGAAPAVQQGQERVPEQVLERRPGQVQDQMQVLEQVLMQGPHDEPVAAATPLPPPRLPGLPLRRCAWCIPTPASHRPRNAHRSAGGRHSHPARRRGRARHRVLVSRIGVVLLLSGLASGGLLATSAGG